MQTDRVQTQGNKQTGQEETDTVQTDKQTDRHGPHTQGRNRRNGDAFSLSQSHTAKVTS